MLIYIKLIIKLETHYIIIALPNTIKEINIILLRIKNNH